MPDKQMDRTERLFDTDSYMTEFDATVLSCELNDKGLYSVILDKTVFFPEEGGQSCDSGSIGDIEVIHVSEKKGVITHMLKEPLEVSKTYHGKINFEERFRKMQNHTGEHIISGIVNKKYGYANTGFHLSRDDVTIDFSGELTKEQLREIEYEANRAVISCLNVSAEYPSAEILSTLNYRSKLELTENVRIVTVFGIDICACCAPHVRNTGEIGQIKILDSQRYKGGVRIHIQCGFDALDDYIKRYDIIYEVSTALSVKQMEVANGVLRVKDEIESLKKKIGELKNTILEYKIAEIMPSEENAVYFFDEADMLFVRNFTNAAVQKCKKIVGVFAGNDEIGYKYIIASKTIDMKYKSKEINSAICGRGGGSSEMIQGSCSSSRKDIEKAFENI